MTHTVHEGDEFAFKLVNPADDRRAERRTRKVETFKIRAMDVRDRDTIEFKGTWYEVMDVYTTRKDLVRDLGEPGQEPGDQFGAWCSNSLEEKMLPAGERRVHAHDGTTVVGASRGMLGAGTSSTWNQHSEAWAHLGEDRDNPVQVVIRVVEPTYESSDEEVEGKMLILPARQLLDVQDA